MSSSSRTSVPPPLDFGGMRTTSSPTTSPSSETSAGRSFASDDYLLDMSSPTYSDRKVSVGSNSSRKSAKVNANSYCGRHSTEYLFGPHGFTDLWRSITKKE